MAAGPSVMLTNEQGHDRERLARYIEVEQITSCMNNTKWAEALSAISSVPGYQPRFRARMLLDEGDPRGDQWNGSFPWHVPTRVFIEWLELDPVVRTPRGQLVADEIEDFSAPLTAALLGIGVPFSIEDGAIRIWGYLRQGTLPTFVTAA
jgi:hypothetical protein